MNGISFNNRSILEKIDATPTADSTNLVTSGGVKTYVDTEITSVDGDVTNLRTYVDQQDAVLDGRMTNLEARTTNPFVFKGTVASTSDLPSSGNTVNDTYFVTGDNCMYAWNGTAWSKASSDDINVLKNDIATPFDATKTYKKDDIVMYNDQVYVRKANASTAESWTPANWKAMSIGDHVANVNNSLTNGIEVSLRQIYNDEEPAYNSSGEFVVQNKGISLDTGDIFSTGSYATRSAITYALLIPEKGCRFYLEPGEDDSYVYGAWCYSSYNTTASTCTYSPSFNKLIPAGQSILVYPINNSKYVRIQVRCLNKDSTATTGSDQYKVLDFTESETSDKKKIESLLHRFEDLDISAPCEATYNVANPFWRSEALMMGFTKQGEVYSSSYTILQHDSLYIAKFRSLKSGTYTLSFDYTSNITSRLLRLIQSYGSGASGLNLGLKNSSTTRHFVRTFILEDDTAAIYLSIPNDATDGTVTISNLMLVEGTEELPYIDSISAIDRYSRSDILDFSGSVQDMGERFNLVNLLESAKMKSDLVINEASVSGKNTNWDGLKLLSVSDKVGEELEVKLGAKNIPDISEGSAKGWLSIGFLDSTDNLIGSKTQIYSYNFAYRKNRFSLTVPDGASYLAILKYSNDSNFIYSLADLLVKQKSDCESSSDVYWSAPINNHSMIDAVSRTIVNRPEIYNSQILRLINDPDPVDVGGHVGYSNFMSSTWDTLVADYPEIFTKETHWNSTPPTSSSETYPIYRIIVNPASRINWTGTTSDLYTYNYYHNYDRTVLITAGCHGNETEGYWGLYRFMRVVYDEGYKYPALRRLRNHVRFIIVPGWSPYAMEHNRRFMSTGESPYHYFGTNEETTIGESAVILDTLNNYPCSLWIDLHTDPYAGSSNPRSGVAKDLVKTGCYAFAPNYTRLADALYDLTCDFHNLVKQEFNYPDLKMMFELGSKYGGSSGHPGFGNSKLPTAILEVATNMEGFPSDAQHNSSRMMKLCTEYYGSGIVEAIEATSPVARVSNSTLELE